MAQNAKGPAATAAPALKPTDEQIAAAFRSIDGPLYDAVHMSNILCDIIEHDFNRPDKTDSESHLVYTFTKQDRDRLMFAVYDVNDRIKEFKKLYLAAWDGEAAR